jgi:thiol-disulfide isomerase/thioredoxin
VKRPILIVALVLSACGSGELAGQELEDLPLITGEELTAKLAESDKPAVVNIWASWCGALSLGGAAAQRRPRCLR